MSYPSICAENINKILQLQDMGDGKNNDNG